MSRIFTLLTFLILLISSNLFGQSFYPDFPDSNARWINAKLGYYLDISSTTNYCMNEEDTLINEVLYSKLDTCEGGYKGALRSDSTHVYFVPRDSTSEYLAYDFGAEGGDIIEDVYFEPYYESGGQLADVEVLGAGPDGLMISPIDFDGIHGNKGYWIRNVGSEAGIFRPPWLWVAEGEAYTLACFSSNDTTYHPIIQFGPGQCGLDLSIEKHSPEDLNLYPNPTSGEVTLDFPPRMKPQEIEVRNALGKVVRCDFLIHGSAAEVDLRHLPPGMYFLSLKLNDRVISKKIIRD